MEIFKIIKGRWLFSVLLLLCLIPSAVWASGADVTITQVKKFDNITAVVKSYITLTYGSITAWDAVWDFNVDTFGNQTGLGDGVSVKATAWDGETPATAPDASKHYGFLKGTTSGQGESAAPITGSILAKYRAYRPFDPQVTAVVEAKTTDFLTDTISGNLTIKGRQQLPGTGEDAEISKYHWRYRVDAGDPTDVETTGNLVIDDAQGPATYYFSLALENQWGTTDYSAEEPYSFGGGDVVGPANIASITLKKKSGDFGLNSFALPFPGPYVDDQGASIALATMQDLVNLVKSKGAIVTAIGTWDENQQVIIGFTLDKDGKVIDVKPAGSQQTLADVVLQTGKGYQLSIDGQDQVTLVIKR